MTKTINTFFQKLLSALLLACCVALGAGTLGCQNVEGEYEEGVTALEADDYETALKKFRSAAQGNHPGA
ncbi:MAG: hypothetical protein ACE1ZE_01170, partial [Candidatus Binatia bacterium]